MVAFPEYEWVVVFGGLAACFAAFGIGANDVANAWATSVGSKALTIRQASFLAVFFEAAGAVLAGSAVAQTFRSGIADVDCFDDSRNDSAILMYGNMWVVVAIGIWLLLATYFEMPVSTTHTAVGAMIGMTIAVKGSQCVIWEKASGPGRLHIPQGVAGIVISWLFSPILSMLVAMLLFVTVRTFILRSKNAFSRAIKFYPILVFVAVFLNTFFIITKGLSKKLCPNKGVQSLACHSGKVRGETAFWIALLIAIGISIVAMPLYVRIGAWATAYVDRRYSLSPSTKGLDKSIEMTRTGSYSEAVVATNAGTTEPAEELSWWQRIVKTVKNWPPVDVHDDSEHDATTDAIHENAEVFDEKAEAVFRYIQIFTAMADSFAHGANDVANAMGPFMTIYFIYNNGKVKKNSDTDDDSYWILAMGAFMMGVGLFVYGYKIVYALGIKMAKITPSRGFAIELGAATIIIVGSYLGIPLSTTHCQVGATVGVGLLEGAAGVNKRQLLITIFGWILTLVVAGVSAGLLVSQAVFAPSVASLHQCPLS